MRTRPQFTSSWSRSSFGTGHATLRLRLLRQARLLHLLLQLLRDARRRLGDGAGAFFECCVRWSFNFSSSSNCLRRSPDSHYPVLH